MGVLDRSTRERGAALVEMALVAPIIALLLIGIIEGGLVMLSYLTAENSVRESARELAINGGQADGDEVVLNELERRLSASEAQGVQSIVVYHPAGYDQPPTTTCQDAAPPGIVGEECTVYEFADFAKSAASLACAWCPTDRAAGDLVGLWIRYEQESISGLFPSFTFDKFSVEKLERGSTP